jgi:hypothetical protein
LDRSRSHESNQDSSSRKQWSLHRKSIDRATLPGAFAVGK